MNTPTDSIPTDPLKFPTPVKSAMDLSADIAALGKADEGNVLLPMEAISSGIRAGNTLCQFIKEAGLLMTRGLIAPFELILRWRFGERYFCAPVAIAFFIFLGLAQALMQMPRGFVFLLLGVFWVLLGINRILCFFRDRKGDYYHSYYEGDSWIRVPQLDAFLAKWHFTFDASKLIIEPLVVIVFGLTLLGVYRNVGFMAFGVPVEVHPIPIYFLVSGVLLFLYQLYCYSKRREMQLNEKDALVVAEAKTLARQPAPQPGVTTHKGVAFIATGGLRQKWTS